jgi:mannosyltransferase OCH1-like enzyme
MCPSRLLIFVVLWFLLKGFPAMADEDLHNFMRVDFETLMGRESGGWEKIQRMEDFEALRQFKTLYEKYKERQLLLSELKIPRIIHFIWLGPKNFPSASVENVRTWVAKNPGWTIKFWTDRARPPPCQGMQVCRIDDVLTRLQRCYEESENWGEKSDLLRYEILFNEGGVYVDHDANCLRSFENLHTAYDSYACLEMPHNSAKGLMITAGIGIIGAKPHHPMIEDAIASIARHWDEVGRRFSEKTPYVQAQLVLHRTYIVLTEMLKKWAGREGSIDIVLPASYFYARKGLEPIYSEHFYGEAWNPDARTPFENAIIEKCSLAIHRLNKILLFEGISATLLSLFLIYSVGRSLFKKSMILIVLGFFCISLEANENFLKMFGEGTPAWKYVETEEDVKNLQLFKDNFENPLKDLGNIPKVFHFLLYDGEEPSQEIVKNILSWKKKHSTWEVKVWTKYAHNLAGIETKRFHDPSLKGKAVLALQILLKEGGVFLDPDWRCEKNIEELLSCTNFCCFLFPLQAPFLSSSVMATPAFIAAAPSHPVIRDALDKMDHEWQSVEEQFSGSDKESLRYKWGYHVVIPFHTAVCNAIGTQESLAVFPWPLLSKFAHLPEKTHDSHLETKFQSDLNRYLNKVEKKEQHIWLLSSAILLLSCGIFFQKLVRKKS